MQCLIHFKIKHHMVALFTKKLLKYGVFMGITVLDKCCIFVCVCQIDHLFQLLKTNTGFFKVKMLNTFYSMKCFMCTEPLIACFINIEKT